MFSRNSNKTKGKYFILYIELKRFHLSGCLVHQWLLEEPEGASNNNFKFYRKYLKKCCSFFFKRKSGLYVCNLWSISILWLNGIHIFVGMHNVYNKSVIYIHACQNFPKGFISTFVQRGENGFYDKLSSLFIILIS